MKTKKNRVWELDFLRGFAIILVVFDHVCYDFGFLFNDWLTCGVPVLEKVCAFAQNYIGGDLRFFWRPAFLFLFFCVSGACTALSRNNLLRGARLWMVAVAVSVVTYVAESLGASNTFVLMGVLHCLALVILLYAVLEYAEKGVWRLVEKRGKPTNPWVRRGFFVALCLAIAGVTLYLNVRYNCTLAEVSDGRISTIADGKVGGFFFFTREWWTADYFPLFPYLSFFFFGAAIGKLVYAEKKTLLPKLEGCWHAPFTFAGRHSLIVYLGGQVLSVVLGILLSLLFLGESLLW